MALRKILGSKSNQTRIEIGIEDVMADLIISERESTHQSSWQPEWMDSLSNANIISSHRALILTSFDHRSKCNIQPRPDQWRYYFLSC